MRDGRPPRFEIELYNSRNKRSVHVELHVQVNVSLLPESVIDLERRMYKMPVNRCCLLRL
jgi:hypothetical protein